MGHESRTLWVSVSFGKGKGFVLVAGNVLSLWALNLTHTPLFWVSSSNAGIARAERDGIRAETRIRLSPKRTSPFKSVGASVQSRSADQ